MIITSFMTEISINNYKLYFLWVHLDRTYFAETEN